jgi:mannosyltransferase OCH1-like enzyme
MSIPRIIHQIWVQGAGELPARYRDATATWRARNGGWTHRLWDESSLREALLKHRPEWWPIYAAQPELVARADVARYALLQIFGGVYADVDTECTRPIEPLIEHSAATLQVTLYSKPRRAPNRFVDVTNSVMASRAGHPVWSRVLDRLITHHHPGINLLSRTGPYMFWPLVQEHAAVQPDDVRLIHYPHALTTAFLPRFCMRALSTIRRDNCILDFNDGGRGGIARALTLGSVVRSARAAFLPRA